MKYKAIHTSLGKEIAIRLRASDWEYLEKHMTHDKSNETLVFVLGALVETEEKTLIVANEIIAPSEGDLDHQSAVGVTPARHFQAYAYHRALQTGQCIIDFHPHPGLAVPHFSCIDDLHARKNARAITNTFPPPVTHVMVVGNNRFDAFDGLIWDREHETFQPLDRLEILGRPTEIRYFGETKQDAEGEANAQFDRQCRIPGWNQEQIERAKIAIVGLGGNGANLFSPLVSMGAGRKGGCILLDHDTIEKSNLPRIPYAGTDDIGKAKVAVAQEFVSRKSPITPIHTIARDITSLGVQRELASATVLFGCTDNDGARLVLNELAVRYSIPLIDLGCDIQDIDDDMIAGGQVRVVLPGQSACLVCCGGINPTQAAHDLMDDADKTAHRAQGYVRNADAEATPSVVSLNGLTAQLALAQFLAITNGEAFGNWDYAHINQTTLELLTATTTRREDCPCCGIDGFLGAGHTTYNSSDANAEDAQHTELTRIEA